MKPRRSSAPIGARTEQHHVIAIDDGQRLSLVDHGELGVAVLFEERSDMERSDVAHARRRWRAVEECLVPRESVRAVAIKLLELVPR